MAENTGTFFPEADNVIAQAHSDLLLAQNNRLDQEQAANRQALALQKAQASADTDAQESVLKALEAQRKADAKTLEKEKKRLKDIQDEIPLDFGTMYGQQGRTLRAMSDDLSENLPQYIEDFGERGVLQLIEQIDLMADDFIDSYTKSQAAAKKAYDEFVDPKNTDGTGTRLLFSQDEWIQTQNILNGGEIIPFEATKGGYVINGVPAAQFMRETVESNLAAVKTETIPDYYPTVVQAWDSYSGAYRDMDYDTMKSTVEANLYQADPHKWSFTAREQYYQRYLKDEQAKAEQEGKEFTPMTRDEFYINEGQASDFRRRMAYTAFTDEWMDIWSANKRDTQRVAREKEARQRQEAEDFAEQISFNTVYKSFNIKSEMLGEFNNTTVPVTQEEIDEAGIKGMAQIPTRLELNLEGLQMAAFGLDPEDSSARLEGVAFNDKGDLYVMYSGKLLDGQAREMFGLSSERAKELGLVNEDDEESRTKQFASRVIRFGQEGWANLMREIGDKKSTATQSKAVQRFFDDIGSPTEAHFYLGVLAVAHATNDKMLDEALSDLKPKGISEQEVMDLLRSR